jgi:hypothetical protein
MNKKKQKTASSLVMPSAADKQYARQIRVKIQLQYLEKMLHAAEKWLPNRLLEFPDTKPEKVLKDIRKRQDKLLKELRSIRKRQTKTKRKQPGNLGLYREIRAVSSLQSFADKIYTTASLPHDLAQLVYKECPDITGTLQGNGFKEYGWANPNDDNTFLNIVFWPLGTALDYSPTGYPSNSYNGNWSGSNGADVVVVLDDIEPVIEIVNEGDGGARAAVFEYTFPKAECDSFISWYTYAYIQLTNGTYMFEDGDLHVDFWVHVSPDGSGFPASATQFHPYYGLDITGSGTNYASINALTPIGGGFVVNRGDQAKLYLGCSFYAFTYNYMHAYWNFFQFYSWYDNGPMFPGVGYRMLEKSKVGL